MWEVKLSPLLTWTGKFNKRRFTCPAAFEKKNHCCVGHCYWLSGMVILCIKVFYFSRLMYLLGYIPKDNRLYLGDKELNIVSFSLLVSVLEYQTAVMRRDFETADKILPMIPREHRSRVAHFLEKQVWSLWDFFRKVDPIERKTSEITSPCFYAIVISVVVTKIL